MPHPMLPFETDGPQMARRRAVIRAMVAGVTDPNPLLGGSSQNTPEAYAARRMARLDMLPLPRYEVSFAAMQQFRTGS